MDPLTLYLTLLASGFVLIGMEIFLPGGILGFIGAVIWAVAGFIGWNNFTYPWNTISAIGLFFILALTIYTWVRFFPKSRMGKKLTLNESINESASYSKTDVEVGDKGIAITTLRPSGIALIKEQRIDVITNSSWIDKNSDIEVTEIHKGHIEVKEIKF